MDFGFNALSVKPIGMNSTMMCKCNYTKLCAEQLLVTLGCRVHCKISHLPKWMEMISLQGKQTSLEIGGQAQRLHTKFFLFWTGDLKFSSVPRFGPLAM
jgi:hypothetical protein